MSSRLESVNGCYPTASKSAWYGVLWHGLKMVSYVCSVSGLRHRSRLSSKAQVLLDRLSTPMGLFKTIQILINMSTCFSL